METAKMEQNSGGSSGSVGDAMSIFGQSIDVRRPGKSRRRAVQKNLSSEIEHVARSGKDRMHRRPAIAEEERARAKSELSRATSTAKKLEQQVEQADAKARSHRSELHGTRASSSSSRRKKGLDVDIEAPGGTRPPESSTVYVEVMQELDRVKRELRQLQQEVKVARESMTKAERDEDASAASSMTTSSGSHVANADGVKRRDADDADEAHAVVELAGAGRSAMETVEATRRTRTKGLQRDTTTSCGSESSDLEAWLTAASSHEGLRHGTDGDSSEATAIATTRREEHDDGARGTLRAAEAELDSARAELESIKGEDLRFTVSTERTRKETARVAEEISRLEEQEKKAMAQVQQLNAKLLEARSRLEAVTAADERAGEILSDIRVTLQQLDEETKAAEKEKALTELEIRCARADAESVDAEIAAAERRVRESIKELEAARASEASATEKLRAIIVESARRATAAVASRRSGNVTIPRFEYEYLTGRAEVVRAVADKKVAAAEEWVEARRAGEKEMKMRAEAIERELGEAEAVAEVVNGESAVEQQTPRGDVRRAHPSKRLNGAPAVTSIRKTTTTTATVPSSPSSAVARKPRAPPLSMKKRKRVQIPNYLKLTGGRCW